MGPRRQELINLIDQGKTLNEIAEYYGYKNGHETVRTAIKRLGLEYESKNTEWTESDLIELKKYLNQGLTYKEISLKFPRTNGNPDYINRLVNSRKGKEFGLVYKGDKKIYVSQENIKKAYDLIMNGEKSIPKIASNLGVYPPSLRAGLYKTYGKITIQKYIGHHIDKKTSQEIHRIFAFNEMTVQEVSKKYGITEKAASELKTNGLKKYYGSGEISEEEYLRRRFTDKKYEVLLNYYHRPPVEFELLMPYNKIFTKEYIEKLYTELDYSNPDLATALGVSEAVADRLRRHFSIPYYSGNMSVGERATLKAIKELGFTNFSKQETVCEIAKPYRDLVYIDFKVEYNEKTYWIEYNGNQHYSYNSFISLTKKNEDYSRFESLLNRDRCVRTYARDNGIILIEIPYTKITVSGIKDILTKIIIESQDSSDVINNLSDLHNQIRSYGVNPID